MSLKRTRKNKTTFENVETVKLDEAKLEEVKHLLSQIMKEIEEAINAGELSDLHPLYEQQPLMIKIQSILEDFSELVTKLEKLKKKLLLRVLRSLSKRGF